MHCVDPGDDWYEPAAHGVQLLSPPLADTVPGLQSVGEVARAMHKLPAGHSTHAVAPLDD